MPTKIGVGPIDGDDLLTGGGILAPDGLVLPNTEGSGIKLDPDAAAFGWHDIIGWVQPKTTGAGTPVVAAFRGNINAYKFIANDVCDFCYHIPHDYLSGSDLFWHVHWGHNGTAISGDFVVTYYATFAKGFDQAVFPAEVTGTLTYSTVNLATTPRYQHRVDEIQLSTPGGSGSMLDTDAIEVDGLIIIRAVVTTLPTITAGSLFIFTSDVHYQSTGLPTKAKQPNFYTGTS